MFASFTRSLTVTVIGICATGIVYSQQGDQKPTAQANATLTWVSVSSEGGIGTVGLFKEFGRGKFQIWRAKIPGGWLVTTGFHFSVGANAAAGGNGVTFVPDPGHNWDGGSLN